MRERVKAINTLFHSLPDLPFLKEFYLQYREYFHLISPCRHPVEEIAQESQNNAESFNEISAGVTKNSQPINSEESKKRSPFNAPCKTLRSQEQEQEQEQEQNNEQKQEKEKEKWSGKPDSFSLDEATIGTRKKHYEFAQQIDVDALAILEFLNQKAKRNYRPVETNLQLIGSRLASGVTITQCRQVIVKKTREWSNDENMANYLRPATLFNPINFEQYFLFGDIPKNYKIGERCIN
jgi:uncharacterized phage protein (TIGR02220 family)